MSDLAELDRPDFDWRAACAAAGIGTWEILSDLADAHEDDPYYRRERAHVLRNPLRVDVFIARDPALAHEVAALIEQRAARHTTRTS